MSRSPKLPSLLVALFCMAPALQAQERQPRSGAYAAEQFRVVLEVHGEAIGGFSEIGGLVPAGPCLPTHPYRAWRGWVETAERIGREEAAASLARSAEICLELGWLRSPWYDEFRRDLESRQRGRELTVRLLDENTREFFRMTVHEGRACRLVGPETQVRSGEVAVESLRICHEGLTLEGR